MTEERADANRLWVGVDISKNDFHAHIWGHDEVLRFEQTPLGHAAFIEQLADQKQSPEGTWWMVQFHQVGTVPLQI